MEGLELQVVGHGIQGGLVQVRQEGPGHGDGVDVGVLEGLALALEGRPDKARVEAGVVGHQHRVLPAELEELL